MGFIASIIYLIIIVGAILFFGLGVIGIGDSNPENRGGGIIWLLIAIFLLWVFCQLPDIYPTCTLDGLL